jgi:hypothetical protein
MQYYDLYRKFHALGEVRHTMARLGAADEIRPIVTSRLRALQGLVAAPGV